MGEYKGFEYYKQKKGTGVNWTIAFPNGFKTTVKADDENVVKKHIDTILGKGVSQDREISFKKK